MSGRCKCINGDSEKESRETQKHWSPEQNRDQKRVDCRLLNWEGERFWSCDWAAGCRGLSNSSRTQHSEKLKSHDASATCGGPSDCGEVSHFSETADAWLWSSDSCAWCIRLKLCSQVTQLLEAAAFETASAVLWVNVWIHPYWSDSFLSMHLQ